MTLLGSSTKSLGCLPIPKKDAGEEDPGRARDRDRKREVGAEVEGERLKRFEAKIAPSGASEVVAGSCCEMMELSGRARPRIPSYSYSRGRTVVDWEWRETA